MIVINYPKDIYKLFITALATFFYTDFSFNKNYKRSPLSTWI